jgi:hypothetical protein
MFWIPDGIPDSGERSVYGRRDREFRHRKKRKNKNYQKIGNHSEKIREIPIIIKRKTIAI